MLRLKREDGEGVVVVVVVVEEEECKRTRIGVARVGVKTEFLCCDVILDGVESGEEFVLIRH